MKIIIETRDVIGSLRTSFGAYRMLNVGVRVGDVARFLIVDDEQFASTIAVHGPYDAVPFTFPVKTQVKRVMTDKEADIYRGLNTLFDDGTDGQFVEVDDLPVITL
jgi:hypothetical protein